MATGFPASTGDVLSAPMFNELVQYTINTQSGTTPVPSPRHHVQRLSQDRQHPNRCHDQFRHWYCDYNSQHWHSRYHHLCHNSRHYGRHVRWRN
jgi:hypothetical protein